MQIARILYPVEVLGPGKRVGIWFVGCERRCRGCSNPELWLPDLRYEVTPRRVLSLVETIANEHPIDGFTFTGGDPLYQYDDCMMLAELLQPISRDILVYTGYRYSEIKQPLTPIAALIDGEYIEEQNSLLPLVGSSNQRLYILKEEYRLLYRDYLCDHMQGVQNFHSSSGHISVGIHRPEFLSHPSYKTDELDEKGSIYG